MCYAPRMTITLTPEQEKLVVERVHSGRYVSAEQITAEAFRLLAAREELERDLTQLRGDIEAGWDDAESGRLTDGPKAMAALLARAQRRLEAPQ